MLLPQPASYIHKLVLLHRHLVTHHNYVVYYHDTLIDHCDSVSLINCMAAVLCGPFSMEFGQVNGLFSTLETNNVASHWSIISLSFPTVLSSVAIHITISTRDCVGPGNILSSLVCTHCLRLIPFVLFRLSLVYLMSMHFNVVVDCLCHFFQIKFSFFFQECLQWFVTRYEKPI